jgi:very-short-patch-repair endonuclease
MAYSRFINESKHLHGADLNTKSKAKVLRRTMTNAEKILWNKLRRKQLNGLYFRRQHAYGIYILDFFCHEVNLAIEVDGDIHLEQISYDNERTKYLESTGIAIIRFSNTDVETRIEYVLDKIVRFTRQRVEVSFPTWGK